MQQKQQRSWIRSLFGLLCDHYDGWPHRDKDGVDWQTCTKCGRRKKCKVQFTVHITRPV